MGGIFVLSFLTALSGALMPGPLLTLTIAQTARDGFLASVSIVAGHSLLELLVVVGLAFGLGRFLKIKPVIATITVLGGLMLLWMGCGMIPGGMLDLRTATSGKIAGETWILHNPVVAGAVVSMSNPYWVIWWATVGVTLFAALARNTPEPSLNMPRIVGVFYLGHIMGDILWYLAVGAAVATGRRLIDPVIYRFIVQICGVFLVFLGASFLYLVATGKLWRINVKVDWLKR